MSDKKELVFFQHFHNGDLFVSKEYVRQVFNELTNVSVSYIHFNHPKTLKDIGIPQIGKPDRSFDNYLRSPKRAPWYVEYENLLLVNTWCEGFFRHNPAIVVPTPHGINHLKMQAQWSHIFQKINSKFGSSLALRPRETYMGKIDYSQFNIAPIDEYIAKHAHRKKILISNGEVMSNQSFSGTMQDIIGILALEFPNWDFICTTKFGTLIPNIYFTDNIIPQDPPLAEETVAWSKKTCDLNEISYLSTFCDIIVGRNSGPFVYCVTERNLMDSTKTIISFNKFEDDSLAWAVKHQANYIWTNRYEITHVLDTIRNEIKAKS